MQQKEKESGERRSSGFRRKRVREGGREEEIKKENREKNKEKGEKG